MKIAFVNPPFKGRFSRTSRSPAITSGGTIYYPFWLAYATGVADEAGHDVILLDAPADDLSLQETIEKLRQFEAELVVVDTSTASIYNDVEVADAIKKELPECYTILVGTHPSALPEETMKLSDSLDAIAIGEYDYTIRDLASVLENKGSAADVHGLALREGDEIVRTGPREKIENLDELPFVSAVYKKHLNHVNYFFAAAKYPMIMIITGRGCPFQCFYCVYPQTFHSRRYRARSPENVVAEFEYIKENFPDVKEIAIEDDCFTANPKRIREICRLLIERKVGMVWYCNVRGDVDFETLRLMKDAGCRLVIAGFESANQQVLDSMNKNQSVEKYHKFAQDAKHAGLMVHGCMMCGTPGDSRSIQEENYQFATKINCDSVQFYPLFVYPGTEAYEWAKEKGYLITEDYSKWLKEDGSNNCVINMDDMTADEMVALCEKNLRRYHLRPRYLLMKLGQAFRDPAEGWRSMKSGMMLIKRVLSKS
ncbi:MAG: B12-binding domain-containing radical SAM protein [Oscillospiraceae bacterium]|nr:B12-binding domain-containing radical SAM protein [Oscillospiraceae bacterium]